LLNGDISEDEDGRGPGDEDEEEEEEEEMENEGEQQMVVEDGTGGYEEGEINDGEEYFEGGIGEETELFQQRMNIGQFTAELKSANIVVQKGGQ
jgi:hypothetical protein